MRSQSQKRKSPAPSRKTSFKSIYGAVRVYTRRHINGCQLKSVDDNLCSCPKWIYAKARGGAARQIAAKTPSFTEASGEAQRILKGFDPEIRAARAITQPAPGISIEDALGLYTAALSRRDLSASYLSSTALPFKRRNPREYQNGRARNFSLLDFLDRTNLTARDRVLSMEQLTSETLDQWAAGWKTNDLSSRTWRGIVTTFLEWARLHGHLEKVPEFRELRRVKSGNRCGYFTDEQYTRLREALPFYRVQHHAQPENYATRLGAFMDLGRWAGMAVCDIVRFSPALNLGANNVLTYRRRKSTQMAHVLLDPAVAARLRSIPAEKGSSPDRPFHFPGSRDAGNRQLWRLRFQTLCRFAGITACETEVGVRSPHPHMLRDSFAIDAISRGVSLENVAKMLGHATIDMTQRSYLFWIQKRIDHCIEDQRAALARMQTPAPSAAAEQDVRIPLRPTLVH